MAKNTNYPAEGTRYWFLWIDAGAVFMDSELWAEDDTDFRFFNSGNFFLNKRKANAAKAKLEAAITEVFKGGKQ